VVVNPTASRLADAGRRTTICRDLERTLTTRFGHAPDWAPETEEGARAALADAHDRPLVVVAGGDGTVRAAADALADSAVPVAVIPGGTGNVLAGTLRIRGVRGALETIRTGVPRRLDLGSARWGTADGVSERTFIVACGMGFDAKIMAAAEHEWKRHLRFGAYIGAAVREALRLEPARFRIVADGVSVEIVGLVVLVANCGDLIPGRLGARQALDPEDGLLDLIVIGGRGIIGGLRGAADVLLRTGELDGAVIRRPVRHVRVEADPPQPTQTDGDVHPSGWLEAAVMPGALTVLAPRG
jgi:diacylglycerol kinase family enzyme